MFMWVSFEKIAFISKPPVFTNFDEQNRLHSIHDYAVYFEDGYGQHYVHGDYFSQELFKKAFKDKTITAEEILKLENEEQKSIIIEYYGSDFYKSLPHKIIDEGEESHSFISVKKAYKLIEIDYGRYKQRYVYCEDYSTDRKYLLSIPSPIQNSEEGYDLDTYRGAVAWTCQNPNYWEELEMRT